MLDIFSFLTQHWEKPLYDQELIRFFLNKVGSMQQQPDKRERRELDAKGNNLCAASSQAWRYGIGDNFGSSNVLSRSPMAITSMNQLNTRLESLAFESQANGGRSSGMPDSVCRQEHRSVASSVVSPTMGGSLMQETQRDHVGHSNGCTSYSFSEPHLRDSTPSNGHPHIIYPESHGVPHCTTPPPLVMSEEPVYVNAKQYHGILRRRQLRAKAESENKAMRARKQPYLHESRHLHALRRARGCGGRFINTKKPNPAAGNATREEGNGTGTLCTPHSGYAPAVSSGLVQSSTSLDGFKRLSVQETKGVKSLQWNCHKGFSSK